MALTQIYCDYATGNDYKGASFTDGAYTSATKTLVKADAFTANKVNHWLYLSSNDGGSIVSGYYKIATWTDVSTVVLATDAGAGVDDDAAKCTQADGTTTLPYRSVQGALDLITRDATNGNQINVKAGTAQVNQASWTLATYGAPTATAPLVIKGYTSTADDGGIAEINCGGFTLWTAGQSTFWSLIDLEVHTGGTGATILSAYAGTAFVYNCKVHKGASTPGANATMISLPTGAIINSHVYNVGTAGGTTAVNAALVIGCYVSGTFANAGIISSGNVINNIVVPSSAGPTGISFINSSGVCSNNTVVSAANGTNPGISVSGASAHVLNNIVQGFSGVGGKGVVIASGLDRSIVHSNAVYNCATPYSIGGDVTINVNNDTLAASPFVDAANGNFNVNGTITGVTEDGWPATFLDLASTTPKPDKGASQAGAGAGGGTVIVIED